MTKQITSFQDFELADKALIATAFFILLVPPIDSLGQKGIVVCSFIHLVLFSFMRISNFSLERRVTLSIWYVAWCMVSFFVYSYFQIELNIFLFAWGNIIMWPTVILFYPQAFYTIKFKKEAS